MSIVLSPAKLDPATVGTPYTVTIGASGGTGPYTFSISVLGQEGGLQGVLPPGITLVPSTGVLSGTTTTTGMYYFTVAATDSLGAVGTQTYILVSGTTSILDIANWITGDYLKRTDIQVAAQNAALDVYRMICAKVPFDELMAVTNEIPLSSGIDTYDLSTLVPPLLGIVNIRVTLGNSPNSPKRRLRRSSARLYDSLSFQRAGQPSTYSRSSASAIQMNPPPDSNPYSMRIRYWTRPPEAATVVNTILATPLEWNPIFKWETAWWVLNMIGQEDRAALLVQPMMMPRYQTPKKQAMMEVGILPRLWNELLSTRSQKENVDEDFGVNPVMRSYSVR